MLFNSYSFIFLYLPIVFIGMFWLGRHSHRLAALWLGVGSLTFYAVWDARFVLLLLASVVFNYGAGYWISVNRGSDKIGRSYHSLVAAISANLILLGYFKYSNFFVLSINQIFESQFQGASLILPLGISFFTFTQIAFLVDAYRGIAREYNFTSYLLFVTYFPHLIAGPVLHHKQMMPQFSDPKTYLINTENVSAGLAIFVLGLSKKVLIADRLAGYASPVFKAASHGAELMFAEAWIGALAYTLQLYFDFSGYSDMAIGLSLLFNVRMPLNFDSPYKATNIIDFWRRWHMTLSAFLRDYLYFTLGGNRKGKARRYVNLMATMLLGGLWHGAGWTFVVWGGLHGVYLMINHGWRSFKARMGLGEGGGLARLGSAALTFFAVVIAWVFFRADSFKSAWVILSGMAGFNGLSLPPFTHARLGPLVEGLPALKITFGGMAPITGVGAISAIIAITFGLAVVWLLPNVRQMLVAHKPTWDDIAGKTSAEPISIGYMSQMLSWRPDSRLWRIVLGILFGLSLARLHNASEFLYFQF
ncbi:MAG: MBOAT family protein [Nitrospinota bacterium]|nr:MBOAT family protein [Nitrospinota bacterium]